MATSQTSALARYNVGRSLSDASELSEFPEEDDHAGENGEVSMISAVPSSNDVLGVHALSIGSPGKAHTRRLLEWRSKVLARVGSQGRSSSQPWSRTRRARSVGLYATGVQPQQRDGRETTSA